MPLLTGLYDGLLVTDKFDHDCRLLADRHYSRRTVGDRQFMPPGRTIVIRNSEGSILFGWNWQFEFKRADRQSGYCCTIFRNESALRSSDLILQCEEIAVRRWGRRRMFTYVLPHGVRSPNPGYCFKCAGWQFINKTIAGLHLLAKE